MKTLCCRNGFSGHLQLAMLLAALSTANIAFGDLIRVDRSGANRCDPFRNANYIQLKKGTTFTSSIVSNGSTVTHRVDFYNFRAPWAQPGDSQYVGAECNEGIAFYYRNETQGPTLGDYMARLFGYTRRWFESKEAKRKRPDYIIKTPSSGGGVRGSLGSSLWGFNLIENSPDGALGDVVLTQAEINGGEKIFVFVDSKGNEDWLSLGVVINNTEDSNVRDTVFFKQPLANFETNQWYEIQVPASLLVAGTNTYTYFLNSAGDTNSSVFIALGVFEDLAPTISQTTSINNIIGFQLSNLVSGFAYSVEQVAPSLTNWQSALHFTASSEVETVTFPMTNSAMFYRVALPPP